MTSSVLRSGIQFSAINSTSAMVTNRGTHFENRVQIKKGSGFKHWLYRPPTRRPPQKLSHFVGRQLGRLTVTGVSTEPGLSLLWVTRCTCGHFETRHTCAIRFPNKEDCCVNCKHLVNLQKQSGSRISIRTVIPV